MRGGLPIKAALLGLGLAIARQLIVGHGGTIEAQSEVGRGTKFTIVLPVASALAAAHAANGEAGLEWKL